jgi:hypothetical protein
MGCSAAVSTDYLFIKEVLSDEGSEELKDFYKPKIPLA